MGCIKAMKVVLTSKKQQLKELIWNVVKHSRRPHGLTAIWKLCFFSEADFQTEHKKRLTHVRYYKNHHGPTPNWNIAKEALDEMVSDGYLVKHSNGVFTVNDPMDQKYIDPIKLNKVKEVCAKYSLLNARELELLSHRDVLYLMAQKKGEINFEDAVYRPTDQDDIEDEQEQEDIEPVELSDKAKQRLLQLMAS